jgi:endonuclease/exonuclease/phosphatase family metal-dependent hydrolase
MSAPLTFDDSFRDFLRDLARFDSVRELEKSAAYRKLRPAIERVLGNVWQDQFAPPQVPALSAVQAVAWNIERGLCSAAVTRALQEHPALQRADILLLSEVDWGMARTDNRFIAHDLASSLKMNYAFAPCYLALTKGAGVEKHVEGDNAESLHGNALMSRFPMHRVHSLALPNGKDKMKGAEKRIGAQRAVIADIAHPGGTFRAVALHLDAHSSQRHRYLQMKRVLNHLDSLTPKLPVLIGGDWNTTTHDASRALYCILGYFRRVLMGIRHVVSNHYPYPERWFERRLFRELEGRGYKYRELNSLGQCTLHYDVKDIAANANIGEWVPQWCFWFTNWALERTGGRCSMKLDWFAGKGVAPVAPAVAIPDLTDEGRRISDHDPIVLPFKVNDFPGRSVSV